MTDVKSIRFRIKRLKKPAIWQLALVFIVFALLSATFLRLNNLGMIERRNAVVEADKTGDETIISNKLYDLQSFVSKHMNTDLGQGVELTETFKRNQTDNIIATQSAANVNIYKQANETCQAKNYKYLEEYRQCVYDYLNSVPGGKVVSSTIISDDEMRLVYIHNYISPLWSADLAGFCVLISAIVLLIISVRLISLLFLRLLLKKYTKSL